MIDKKDIYALLQGEAAPDIWERAAQNIEQADITDFLIDDTTDTSALEPVFSLGSVEVMHRGDISALMGVVKCGKSAAAGLIAAAILAPNPAAIIRTAAAPAGARVLYFDTEQSRMYAKRHYLEITGGANCPRLKYIATAENTPNERRLILQKAIEAFKPDFVIIDGIADLMTDTNCNTEAAAVVQIVRSLASLYNCHILNVIHQNNTGGKARGHIGSELWRKCEAVLECTKNGDSENLSFEITFPITRGKQPSQISFVRGENGQPAENSTPRERLQTALKEYDGDTIDFKEAQRICKENAVPMGVHVLRACLFEFYGHPEKVGSAGKAVWIINREGAQ